MSQLQPEQATFLLNAIYLPDLKNEHRITRSVIEAIPSEQGEYRPDDISKCAMDLAWHIAATEMFFLDAVAAGMFNLAAQKRAETIRTPQDLASWYEQGFSERLAKLDALTGDELTRSVDFRGAFQLPAVRYLGVLLRHSIHHRGQLSAYLRPMGAKVPAIYGESYDSAQARKAAQAAS